MKNLTCVLLFASVTTFAQAQTVFAQNLTGFNAATGAQQTYDFEGYANNANIGGTSDAGLSFSAFGSPLIVVNAADTFTPAGLFAFTPNPASNVLSATSGRKVLSPGGATLGSGPDVDRDGVVIQFSTAQRFFGFDHLSQSADGASFTSITIFDALNNTIYSGGVPISNVGNQGGGAPGAPDFWGIVFSSPVISKVVISEQDDDLTFPDANIGFDTLRYEAVPEPASMLVLGAGVAALARRRRKNH